MKRILLAVASIGLLVLIPGCWSWAGLRPNMVRDRSGSAGLFGQFQAYNARSGDRITFRGVFDRCRDADVVLFGEQHNDAICNQLEAELLAALAAGRRPVALAMEFFEADTQAPLDAYLNGRIGEDAFRDMARQKRAYLTAHRPMIEFCRAAHIPVIAANAPRRLVRALGKSGLPFDEFRASQSPSDRALLPTRSEMLTGPYRDRFFEIMKNHVTTTAPTSQAAPTSQTAESAAERALKAFRPQLLWDASMAEAVANHRARHERSRVMLVVGSFHVQFEGGTLVKLRQRRPDDAVRTIVYRTSPDTRFEFQEDDRGAGDIVIYGLVPPAPKKSAAAPTSQPILRPTTQPTTSPTTLPTETDDPAQPGDS